LKLKPKEIKSMPAMQSKIVYLAAPYTHEIASVRAARFNAVTLAAAKLIEKGHIVYSPLTMTHPIDLVMANGHTLGSKFWVDFDEAFMEVCSEMVLLCLSGWERSSGVARELAFFRERNRPISFIEPGDEIADVSLPQ
jgi:hypothetical protein